MPELERKLAAWRAAALAALPGQPDTVRELEDHLRDRVATLMEQGTEPVAALDVATKELGELNELAREFRRARSQWFGALHSPQLRILARFGACMGFVGFVFYFGLTLLFVDRIGLGKGVSPQPPLLAAWLVGSFSLVCVMALNASVRFLSGPTVDRARGIVSFALLIVWILAGQLITFTALPLAVKQASLLVALALLLRLWRGWVTHLERSRPVAVGSR